MGKLGFIMCILWIYDGYMWIYHGYMVAYVHV